MKELTAQDLFSLKYGDKVYFVSINGPHPFDYVGRMPSSPNRYLIFSSGETLKHLYIHKDGSFSGTWYGGDYDDGVYVETQIRRLEKELKSWKEQLKPTSEAEIGGE